jgi:hypothetical protein
MKKKRLPSNYFKIPCCLPYGATYDFDQDLGKVLPGPIEEDGFTEKTPQLSLKLSTNEKRKIGEDNDAYSLLYFCHEQEEGNIPIFLEFMNACSDSLNIYLQENIDLYSIVKDASRKTHSELLLNAPNWKHATNAVSLWAKFRLFSFAYVVIIDPKGNIIFRQDLYDSIFDYTLLDQILFAIQEGKKVNH